MTRTTHLAAVPAAPLPAHTDRLWTPQDVAAYLSVPLATLYQWRYHGIGPAAYRVGRHLRYEPAAVRSWLTAQAS